MCSLYVNMKNETWPSKCAGMARSTLPSDKGPTCASGCRTSLYRRLSMPSVRAAGARAVPDAMRALLGTGQVDADAHAFYVANLSEVARRLREFRTALPRVAPFYAVKLSELRLVADALLNAQLRARVVYANPVKAERELRLVAARGVTLMTFDSADELRKVRAAAPHARLLLRVAVGDSLSRVPLATKFGAHTSEVRALLTGAHRLGLTVVGVAFHVGSGCLSARPYVDALQHARAVFDEAAALGMPPLSVLDIGGGFPGFDGEVPITFTEIAAVVRPRIDALFGPEVNVIAEPGRYFVASAYSLATKITSMRRRGPVFDYYIGEGVYGSFKDALLLNLRFEAKPLFASADASSAGETHAPSNLYGPTQDPHDVVLRNVM
eukprot:IDg10504t1